MRTLVTNGTVVNAEPHICVQWRIHSHADCVRGQPPGLRLETNHSCCRSAAALAVGSGVLVQFVGSRLVGRDVGVRDLVGLEHPVVQDGALSLGSC